MTACNIAEKSKTGKGGEPNDPSPETSRNCDNRGGGAAEDDAVDEGPVARGVIGFIRFEIRELRAAPCCVTHSEALARRHTVPIAVVGMLKEEAASCSLQANVLAKEGAYEDDE